MRGDVSGEAASSGGGDGDGGFDRATFVEEMGLLWEIAGSGRMDGRIIAYLLITDVPYVSSGQLAAALQVSAGSISLATRRLIDAGFVKRHAVPGERSRYFRVDDDVWGSFLAGERRYLDQQCYLAEQALELLGPEEEAPRRRLRNMRDYMRWVQGGHRDLLALWRDYQRQSLTDRPAVPGGMRAAPADRAAPERAEASEEDCGLSYELRRLKTTLSPVLARRLVSDTLWEAAEPLLTPTVTGGDSRGPRGPRGSHRNRERAALTAVVYVLTSGCGWQQLPDQFGVAPATAHRRFTAWRETGFWQEWLDALTAGTAPAGAEAEWCAEIVKAAENRRPAAGRGTG